MKRSQIRWYLRRGIDAIRYEGLHILLWRMLKLGLPPLGFLGMSSFCRKDLTQPLGERQAKVDLIVSQATEADIDQLATLAAKRYSPKQMREKFKTQSIQETIRDRFQQGAKCFVGKIGTEMVHHGWIFFHRKELSHRCPFIIHLSDREALCDDGFTVEEWRGKGIHGAVMNQRLLFLQQSGFRTAYTLVNTDNISSKKTMLRLGWNFYGTVLTFSPHKSDKVLKWEIRGPLDPFVVKKIRKPEMT